MSNLPKHRKPPHPARSRRSARQRHSSRLSFQQLEARRMLAADLRFVLGSESDTGTSQAIPSELLHLNNDGFPDFVVANPSQNSLQTYLGKGDGTFELKGTYSGAAFNLQQPKQVIGRDLNNDGKLDLLVANGWYVTAMIGQGDGTLQYQGNVVLNGLDYLETIAAADLDQDGRLDLIAAHQKAGTAGVSVFRGAPGGFSAATFYAQGNHGLQLVDLNQDQALCNSPECGKTGSE